MINCVWFLCCFALPFLLGTANQWTSVPLALMRTYSDWLVPAVWAAQTMADLQLGVPSPKSEPYFGNHWTPTPNPSSSTPTQTMPSVAFYVFSFQYEACDQSKCSYCEPSLKRQKGPTSWGLRHPVYHIPIPSAFPFSALVRFCHLHSCIFLRGG